MRLRIRMSQALARRNDIANNLLQLFDLGETAIFRYKTIIGRGLRARTLPSQKTEARVACSVLNRMTRLGMPVSQRIA